MRTSDSGHQGSDPPARSTCFAVARRGPLGPTRLLTAVLAGSLSVASSAAEPPPLQDGVPRPGRRVRLVAPGWEASRLRHAVYLPRDWRPNRVQPVIVELPPNRSGPFAGTAEDTQLGYFASGGRGWIWVSLPCVDDRGTPEDRSDDVEATTWWGSGVADDPVAASATAAHARSAVEQVVRELAGDGARVVLAGFSRGAVGAGFVGLRDELTADVWAAFFAHSHHDGASSTPDPELERLGRIRGRSSFLSAGTRDAGRFETFEGARALEELGFHHELRLVPGSGHSDDWIRDDAPEEQRDVRWELRAWLATVREELPGTGAVHGRVLDAGGTALAGALVSSGPTHRTRTDADGRYLLEGLLPGERELRASAPGLEEVVVEVELGDPGSDFLEVDLELTGEAAPCPAVPVTSALPVLEVRRDGEDVVVSWTTARALGPAESFALLAMDGAGLESLQVGPIRGRDRWFREAVGGGRLRCYDLRVRGACGRLSAD